MDLRLALGPQPGRAEQPAPLQAQGARPGPSPNHISHRLAIKAEGRSGPTQPAATSAGGTQGRGVRHSGFFSHMPGTCLGEKKHNPRASLSSCSRQGWQRLTPRAVPNSLCSSQHREPPVARAPVATSSPFPRLAPREAEQVLAVSTLNQRGAAIPFPVVQARKSGEDRRARALGRSDLGGQLQCAPVWPCRHHSASAKCRAINSSRGDFAEGSALQTLCKGHRLAQESLFLF